MMTKHEAIKNLDSHDHAILSKEGVEKICEPFGFMPHLTKIQDRRSELKGAHFPDLKEGEWAHDVIGARSLAVAIADHLGVKYADYFGEGTMLHETCRSILKWLDENPSI